MVGTRVLAVICALAVILVHFSLATNKPPGYTYAHANGWRELATSVMALKQEQTMRIGETPFIIGNDKYNIAAELGFYLQDPQDCINGYAFDAQGLGYRYWTDLQQFKGRSALIILLGVKSGKTPEIRPEWQSHFDRLDEPQPFHVEASGALWRNDYVIKGYGYRP